MATVANSYKPCAAIPSNRNPYPFPRLQNDENFFGRKPPPDMHLRPALHGHQFHLPSGQDTWNPLNTEHTLRYVQKDGYSLPTHLAQQEDPWNRLNSKHTLTSSRHEVFHFDPQAPRDSLDFIVKSKYDHHEQIFKNRNEVVFQKETCDADQAGRKLKNRIVVKPKVIPELKHPIVITDQVKRESEHSRKTAIEGYHTQTTNKGYSRKPDGGFFVS